ncbi:HTH-type transcriptional regulator ArgP [Caballeronia mineralivorans]|uniref:HTH-type transcriptional regulator ArgP n=1 Tax=Caballeronia mineralivorans TaxID=2010198 RepID=UPI0009E5A28A|nr:HTH-type transcriptional regulator ArgP [Caballeronia mineralivorans]
MLDRYQLEAFASVVETMSFERAAERLNVTRAAISQRIKALEEALSAAVLVRSKPLTLTLAGEVLFKHVAAVRLLEADTFNQIDPQGNRRIMPLAVGVDVYSIDAWFSSVAQQIIKRNVIELEVVVDDANPAFPALTRGELIGSVSTVPRPVHGCIAEPIGDMIYRCVASPAFMERYFANGFSLHATASAPAVSVGRGNMLLERYFDAAFGMAVGRYRKNLLPSVASQLDTIVADLGYGMLPEQTVLPLLESGRLVDVRRDLPFPVTLYWHRWRAAPPICEAISVEIVEFAREILQERKGHESPGLFTTRPSARCSISMRPMAGSG